VVHRANGQINVPLAAISKFALQAPAAANAPISIFFDVELSILSLMNASNTIPIRNRLGDVESYQ
jgi:hypothetical protein